MTSTDIINIITTLRSDSTLQGKMTSSNIVIGWMSTLNQFPSVVVTPIGGSSTGQLGYNSATAGNKHRTDDGTVQIDIYSTKHNYETMDIGDRIDEVLISGVTGILNMSKASETQMYDDEMNVWRKSMRWNYVNRRDD